MVGRRWILTQTGRGAMGIAVLGFAGAATQANPPTRPRSDQPEISPPAESGTAEAAGGLAWSRVDLGFVAAYVLVRGREAAVVDTGVAGSVDAIGAVLERPGPGGPESGTWC